MTLGGLFKNKRTLYIGGAAAVAVGALWAYTHHGASLSGTTQPQATLDTSATDMSQALDSAQASWSADLREFSTSLQTVMDRLNTLPPAGTANPGNQPTPPYPVWKPTPDQIRARIAQLNPRVWWEDPRTGPQPRKPVSVLSKLS